MDGESLSCASSASELATAGHCIAAKSGRQAPGNKIKGKLARTSLEVVFWGIGVGGSWPSPSAPKINFIRQQPVLDGPLGRGRRAVSAMVAIALRTIHPNPGPFARDKSEAGRERRRAWRKARRAEKRAAKAARVEAEDAAININAAEDVSKLLVATWNVQRMSLVSRRRERLREVVEYAGRSEWDVVLCG